MSTTETDVQSAHDDVPVRSVDMKLEVVVIPVSDVNRARDFYVDLGWRIDADVKRDNFRLVQLTPPGSECSVQFGTDITPAAPGSAQWVYLVVSDIKGAVDALAGHGIEVSDVFREGPLEIGSIMVRGSWNLRLTAPAMARLPRSAIPMVIPGCSRRLPSGYPAVSMRPQHPSRQRPSSRRRCVEHRRPTTNMRSVWAVQTRTGHNGMRST